MVHKIQPSNKQKETMNKHINIFTDELIIENTLWVKKIEDLIIANNIPAIEKELTIKNIPLDQYATLITIYSATCHGKKTYLSLILNP